MSTRKPVTGNIDHWQKVAQDDTARKEISEWGKNSDTSWVFVEGGTTHPKEKKNQCICRHQCNHACNYLIVVHFIFILLN